MQGRIIKHIAGTYTVLANGQKYDCKATAKFRFNNQKPLVGDIVEFDNVNNYITDIEERKNELVRPNVSNVDQALIVTSIKEPDLSTYLLDKLIALVELNYIKPILVFSKADISSEYDHVIENYAKIGYPVFKTTKDDKKSVEVICTLLKDKVSVIAGQTGVGKSTLINTIAPTLKLDTQEISKALGRGKHTTRHVELHELCQGLIADTPGFSSLELLGINAGDLAQGFIEFYNQETSCRFKDCKHKNEPGCAVKENVEKGNIAKYRYENYLKLLEEIESRKERY